MYRIIHTSRYWISVSVVLFVLSIVFALMWGFNLGIDFLGGTVMDLRFATERPALAEVNTVLAEQGIQGSRTQYAGDANVLLKMPAIDNDQRQQLIDHFSKQGATEDSFTTVGPSLGEELKSKAVVALVLVMLAIVAFVSYAFRGISHAGVPSWVFGLSAILALVHDVVIVTGVFIVLGHFYDVQIDSYFVTALLTLLGFSVNDTIVVFDRIREGLKHRAQKSFLDIVNESINTTLARSINTSFTTLLVLLALYLFGGESIRYLVLALMCGIVIGTYSSIFIASPLLLLGRKLLGKN